MIDPAASSSYHSKKAMLTLFLPRRNIRLHLALPHRLPDRPAPLPARHRLLHARVPPLARQRRPRRRSPLHPRPPTRRERRRRRKERGGVPGHSQHLRTRAQDGQAAELPSHVLRDRIRETAHGPPRSARGLASDHAGVDRNRRYVAGQRRGLLLRKTDLVAGIFALGDLRSRPVPLRHYRLRAPDL